MLAYSCCQKNEGYKVNKLKHGVDRDFTAAPNVIFRDQQLSFKAKGLWLQILSLPENWNFSITGLAKLAKDNNKAIKTGIDELVTAGYLEWAKERSTNGRFTVVVTTSLPQAQKPHDISASGQKATRQNADNKYINNKHLTVNKNLNNNPTNVELAKAGKPVYGKPEINQLFEYWHQTTGYEIASKVQANRNACNNLLKRHGFEKVKQLINGAAKAQRTEYAPRIADFCALQSKLNDLLVWGRSATEKEQVNMGIVIR